MGSFRLEQSEAQFQAAVQGLATLNGWSWMHIRPGLNERGHWRTPVTGPLGAGFPDLLMVKGDRVIFAELKAQRGTLTVQQKEVMGLLAQVRDVEVFVWRPSDWPLICEVLVGQRGEDALLGEADAR